MFHSSSRKDARHPNATYYNANGAITGRSTRVGNTISFYNANGACTGRAYLNGGSTTYYDSTGKCRGRKTYH
jgi:hypothetical protein